MDAKGKKRKSRPTTRDTSLRRPPSSRPRSHHPTLNQAPSDRTTKHPTRKSHGFYQTPPRMATPEDLEDDHPQEDHLLTQKKKLLNDLEYGRMVEQWRFEEAQNKINDKHSTQAEIEDAKRVIARYEMFKRSWDSKIKLLEDAVVDAEDIAERDAKRMKAEKRKEVESGGQGKERAEKVKEADKKDEKAQRTDQDSGGQGQEVGKGDANSSAVMQANNDAD